MEKYIIGYLDLPDDIKYVIYSYFPNTYIHKELQEKITSKYWYKRLTINDRFLFYEFQQSLGGDRRTVGRTNIKNIKILFQKEELILCDVNKKIVDMMHYENLKNCHFRNVYKKFAYPGTCFSDVYF